MNQFYLSLNKQLEALLEGQRNWIANLSQFAALLNMNLEQINWVGFYLSQTDGSLKLGPFQGNVACFDIPVGKGVCGASASKRAVMLVDDVHQFDGHIACDSRSQSEIVCPLVVGGQLIGVLDIDSPILSRFNQQDSEGLQLMLKTLVESTDWPNN